MRISFTSLELELSLNNSQSEYLSTTMIPGYKIIFGKASDIIFDQFDFRVSEGFRYDVLLDYVSL